MARGVALLSGGLDSGVATAKFAATNDTLALALFCSYGQRAVSAERRASVALAERLDVPWREVSLPWLGELARTAGSALVDPDRELPRGTAERPGDAASARAVWVPARNAVFVAVAAAHAEAAGADLVIAGFNREEAATFPDNSAEFVATGSEFLRFGTRNSVRVVSPTVDLDKRQLVAAARELGFAATDFWSCYEAGEKPCGTCESCRRSVW
ncbi:MAG: 7-cyano-7-deazaguanine synthase [bacterium]|nr:7-cyano-7-deazaguanine synthase [bacterium]